MSEKGAALPKPTLTRRASSQAEALGLVPGESKASVLRHALAATERELAEQSQQLEQKRAIVASSAALSSTLLRQRSSRGILRSLQKSSQVPISLRADGRDDGSEEESGNEDDENEDWLLSGDEVNRK